MDTDGVNFRHQKQKEKAKKFSYEEARKKKEAKQHSKKAQVYQANEGSSWKEEIPLEVWRRGICEN